MIFYKRQELVLALNNFFIAYIVKLLLEYSENQEQMVSNTDL